MITFALGVLSAYFLLGTLDEFRRRKSFRNLALVFAVAVAIHGTVWFLMMGLISFSALYLMESAP